MFGNPTNHSGEKKAALPILWTLLLCLLLLSGCSSESPAPSPTPHVHTWAEANCERPATCTLCGETQGVALGHSWAAGDNGQPRHCKICGLVDTAPTPVATAAPTPTPEEEDEWPPYPLASTNIVPPSDPSYWLDTPRKRIVTAPNNAYQFSAPDDYAERFSTVKKDTVVEMLAQEGEYGLCLYRGQILGWVRVKWLEPYGQSPRKAELYTENRSCPKRIGVTVAHSQDLDQCISCIGKLQSAGYNAFIYEIPGKAGYGIIIGIFGTKAEAEELAACLHEQQPVKDVQLENAYCVSVYLPDAVVACYADPWLASAPASSTTAGSSSGYVPLFDREAALRWYYDIWNDREWTYDYSGSAEQVTPEFYLADVDGDGIEELLVILRSRIAVAEGYYLLYTTTEFSLGTPAIELLSSGVCSSDAYVRINRNAHVLGIFEYHTGCEYGLLFQLRTGYKETIIPYREGLGRYTELAATKDIEYCPEEGETFDAAAGSAPWTGSYQELQSADMSAYG